MATKTTNYQLIKPSEEDFYDIDDFNQNADLIDAEVKKSNDNINLLKRITTISLQGSRWSTTFPYTQTVNIPGVTVNDHPVLAKALTGTESEATVKAYNKAFSFIFSGETGNGNITLRAFKRPVIDLLVSLKGV